MKNYFKSLFGVAALFLFTLSAVAQAPLQYRVDTIQGLLNVTLYGADAKVTAWVGGGTARDDGLGGVFFYDGNSAVSTNVYAVYKPVNNAGRWFKLPTQVAYQTAAVTVGDDTTYAWKLLRAGQTNFFGIGADNTTAYLQTFNGKTLQINNLGNNTILNATAGNVGIGTTAPGSPLEVAGQIASLKAATTGLLAKTANVGAAAYLELLNTGTGGADWVLATGNSAYGSAHEDLYFYKNTAGTGSVGSKLTIQASGNVGIGTTAPAGLLHVSSDTAATGLSYFTQANASSDGFDQNFRKARGTGAVPTVITTADELGVINFTGYGGASGYITGAAIKGISSGTIADTRVPGFLSLWTGTDATPSVLTERMRINNAGNVGIGTTTPAAKLDVAGTLLVGTSPVGQAIYGIYSAAAEIDFPPIIAQSVTNMTMTVTGAGTNSTVTVSSANGTVATANGLTFSAWVSATNTVTIRAANGTLDPWDPASSSYRATVFQY